MIEWKTLGKWENGGYQHFLTVQQCFEKLSFSVFKTQDCTVRVNKINLLIAERENVFLFLCVLARKQLIEWTGVLCRFQQYFSHIKATAHVIYVFLGFHQYQAGAQRYLAQGLSHEKTRAIQCGLNPRLLDCMSNTLPLSCLWPYQIIRHSSRHAQCMEFDHDLHLLLQELYLWCAHKSIL